ncbi:terminase small subunit [Tuwongella immobilis]|uniref:Terminase small subunit n=1 Tax=Tuwongella immobilis TaxID=692036 RepID=A0A6C2YPM6_9BACT|nr:terminase small subunit [Tuwongella immobilis]VIP03083.1 phage terminase small subunit : Phage Terminase Small Subunit OS=Gluconobacter oxydans (strain 621H) GN=GOX2458 PE=4 SV=1: Terminase_2 [Tuwongella immobilis]VTS03336.1 phage terminase small subunit : Phage Terminase Small Subunit OS=Gluconobacter oxydans (strain 621H) GN=GOX2458 PE=4 SV=1: Terminase_2 [Tuwongella immobilis]
MLSPLQERFCLEYLVDLNASAAARRAGYSHRTAGQQGERLLKKVEIQNRIRELNAARSQRTEISADRVLAELGRIAFLDVRKLFTDNGTLRPLPELDEDTARAVSSVDIHEEVSEESHAIIKKIRTWDKVAALDKLARHLGLFVERLEHSGKVTIVTAEDLTDEQLANIAASRGE